MVPKMNSLEPLLAKYLRGYQYQFQSTPYQFGIAVRLSAPVRNPGLARAWASTAKLETKYIRRSWDWSATLALGSGPTLQTKGSKASRALQFGLTQEPRQFARRTCTSVRPNGPDERAAATNALACCVNRHALLRRAHEEFQDCDVSASAFLHRRRYPIEGRRRPSARV